MTDFKSKTVLVWDNGLFCELAVTLSKQFGRVLYFSPWCNGYPTSKGLLIGQGVKGIERIVEPWSYIDQVDLFVFPDVYEGTLQEYLANQGKRVWGCRLSAELELDRVRSKELSAGLGIDIGPYKAMTGLDALREHLKAHDDQYVKISATRGDMETFHAPSYDEIEPRLDELEHTLGAKKKIMEFIVEQAINDAIEIGYDGYSIDGKFPKGAIVGVEVKDKGYVGRTMRYSETPESVRGVNDKLAPVLKKYKHRGFLSTEIRATKDGKAYLIDPCQRCGSPPSELYQNMISNLAEIMWYGAEGIVVEPEYKAKWGAMILLLSDWADKNWQQVSFPSKYRENVKLRNFCVIDGEYYVIPQASGMPEIGAVVAMGDTAQAAIDECKRIAKLVEGYSVEHPVESLDEAYANLKEILTGEKPDKPKREPSHADDLVRKGLISQRAYEKMIAGR